MAVAMAAEHSLPVTLLAMNLPVTRGVSAAVRRGRLKPREVKGLARVGCWRVGPAPKGGGRG